MIQTRENGSKIVTHAGGIEAREYLRAKRSEGVECDWLPSEGPDVVITIATKRRPPVVTLNSFEIPAGYSVIVVADPLVYQEHLEAAQHLGQVSVKMGKQGLGANKAECYRYAAEAGFRFFFLLDDDLPPNYFVGRGRNNFPQLLEVLNAARDCVLHFDVTYAGFANTINSHWMKDGFSRTVGLIEGSANIAYSCQTNYHYFLDPSIVRAEEAYRTCSHREYDLREGGSGLVGRVSGIGLDRRVIVPTIVSQGLEEINASRDMILERFPGMLYCVGAWHNGCPRWRFTRISAENYCLEQERSRIRSR